MTGALLAGTVNQVTVTLPHAVAVGSVTLPSGQYTLTNFEMGGDEFFVVRGENGAAATLQAQLLEGTGAGKTQVIFSKEGDVWHFDKLELPGEGLGFQFTSGK